MALADVRASQGGASIIDAACLNALGTDRTFVRVTVPADGREVTVAPGVLSGLFAEIRLEIELGCRTKAMSATSTAPW